VKYGINPDGSLALRVAGASAGWDGGALAQAETARAAARTMNRMRANMPRETSRGNACHEGLSAV
jgi:hypothetical protein